jgi:hypothetical protein
MTLLGLRRENACPRAYANGCTDGDTRGASVKESSVWTRLLICEHDLTIDKRRKKQFEIMCCDWPIYGAVCRTNLQYCQNVGGACPVWMPGKGTCHISCMF